MTDIAASAVKQAGQGLTGYAACWAEGESFLYGSIINAHAGAMIEVQLLWEGNSSCDVTVTWYILRHAMPRRSPASH
jgi:hypothetical protein